MCAWGSQQIKALCKGTTPSLVQSIIHHIYLHQKISRGLCEGLVPDAQGSPAIPLCQGAKRNPSGYLLFDNVPPSAFHALFKYCQCQAHCDWKKKSSCSFYQASGIQPLRNPTYCARGLFHTENAGSLKIPFRSFTICKRPGQAGGKWL